MSDRRIFFNQPADADLKTCRSCGGTVRFDELARDASRKSGRKSICVPCDNARSKRYYEKNRDAVLARAAARRPVVLDPLRFCSEDGVLLEGRQRVVCSPRCRDARYRRTHPAEYAASEARKVERRRQRRREGGS